MRWRSSLRNLRAKKAQLHDAMVCRIEQHHLWLLKVQLGQLEHLEAAIEKLEAEIDKRVEPYRDQVTRLAGIPGVGKNSAAAFLAEMGADMTVFPTAGHFAAWAGVCPGNNESAGKRFGTPARKGNPYLRSALIEAATSAVRTKGTYYRDKYYRMGSRMPKKKAKVAIAHKMALAAYTIRAVIARCGHPAVPLDDAFIHFQYAKRLASGHFFSYVAGEGYSSGATSLLWPVVLAPLYAVGLTDLSIIWAA